MAVPVHRKKDACRFFAMPPWPDGPRMGRDEGATRAESVFIILRAVIGTVIATFA
jgi:hypothetical protein